MKILNEILFWVHLSLIVFGVLLGYFFSLTTVFIIHTIHRFHIWWFKECLLSRLQKKLGGLPKELDFQQAVVKRLFGIEITKSQNKKMGFSLVAAAIIVALVF